MPAVRMSVTLWQPPGWSAPRPAGGRRSTGRRRRRTAVDRACGRDGGGRSRTSRPLGAAVPAPGSRPRGRELHRAVQDRPARAAHRPTSLLGYSLFPPAQPALAGSPGRSFSTGWRGGATVGSGGIVLPSTVQPGVQARAPRAHVRLNACGPQPREDRVVRRPARTWARRRPWTRSWAACMAIPVKTGCRM
jgi:hypothetical protein